MMNATQSRPKRATQTLTRTAALLALLVILQAVTKPAGQLVTGSCVNAVLAVGALLLSVPGALVLALVSPFLAFALGIGPQLLPVVPAIAVGNGVYVLLLGWLGGKARSGAARWGSLALAAVAKFLALYLLVVQLLCRVLSLPEKQTAVFSAMFSWPQLVTALVGGVLALVLAAALRRQG